MRKRITKVIFSRCQDCNYSLEPYMAKSKHNAFFWCPFCKENMLYKTSIPKVVINAQYYDCFKHKETFEDFAIAWSSFNIME